MRSVDIKKTFVAGVEWWQFVISIIYMSFQVLSEFLFVDLNNANLIEYLGDPCYSDKY